MAGSVNSDDLEDVLSSIRRLVSEDLRPAPRPQIFVHPTGAHLAGMGPASAGPASTGPAGTGQAGVGVAGVGVAGSGPASVRPVGVAASPVAADKLILTPALRVLSMRTLTVVPKVAQPPVEASAVQPMARLHLGAEHGVARTTPDVVTTLGQGVDQGHRLDWESETGDPEPDVDGLDWSSFTFARRSMQETFAARVIAAEIATPVEAHVKQVWAHSVPEAPMAEDVSSEPEDCGEPGHWADLAEAQALADLGASAAIPEPEAEVIGGSQQEEDSIFSEQVLRELVRDLIREQLQGDLGERITRNIRKMVRAEVSNALAVHKLD